ncbi:MAG: radical SAM protein [Candidatus Nanoarchaeia archaeon]|jgi:radical SAM superfamily enzyme YgiQ (UPF0313 family)
MILINPNSGINRDLPNMSLAYIATLKKSRVIDLNTKQKPKKRYLKVNDDTALISIRSAAYNESKRIKAEYKRAHPKSRVKSVTGVVDVQCCYPFNQFKSNVNINNDFNDKLPFPDYSLFDSYETFRDNWSSGKWAYPVLTSLGCPFQCIYCASRNRRLRMRSAKNCYEEIKKAKKEYDIKSFQIIDDCFNAVNKRVIEFCELIKPLNLKWFCTNGLRADLFNKEQAKAISGSGCNHVSFGVESLSLVVLKNIKKGLKPEQVKKAVRIAKKYFRSVNCYFIIGLPGSTYKSDLANVEWVKNEGVNGHFSYFIPPTDDSRADMTFYGEHAKPQSDAYPKEQQEAIYKMTQSMRPYTIKYYLRRLLKKVLNK